MADGIYELLDCFPEKVARHHFKSAQKPRAHHNPTYNWASPNQRNSIGLDGSCKSGRLISVPSKWKEVRGMIAISDSP